MSGERCKNCRWFRDGAYGESNDWCHRYPTRQKVSYAYFCGEFTPLPKAPDHG